MLDSSESEIESQLRILKEAYAAKLPLKLAEIETGWAELTLKKWDARFFESFFHTLHKLTGSGTSYGFPAVSSASRDFELVLKPWLDSTPPPTTEQIEKLSEKLADLREAILSSYRATMYPKRSESSVNDHLVVHGEGSKLIYLVEKDLKAAESLALQIGYFGYEVSVIPTMNELWEQLKQEKPAAIITDILFPEDYLSGTRAAAEAMKNRAKDVPIIFISSRADMAARLQAIRAGGKAFFTKPFDIASLIDKLDNLLGTQGIEPYRVMIINDDSGEAKEFSEALRNAKMLTQTISSPLNVLQPLEDFAPDLILLDYYMPRCSGSELARVIRQQEAYISIPIVFMAADSDQEKQIKALESGGDDFLIKKIPPAQLIAFIEARITRSRLLRSLMTRDGLTGLLNHTKTKEQLDLEIARARRRSGSLVLAMIDIDHFKLVNDTYGHPTGDRVLKSLARILQQRLRRTDIVGRYGGEEFVAILLDTEEKNAYRVLDEIREGFSQVEHQSEDKEFRVTFSCGLASFPSFEDATSISDAADKALYEAKRGGRNRIVLAEQYLF